MSNFIPKAELRARFARALSEMYAKEVPLYQTLVDTVREVNEEVIAKNQDLESEAGDLDRVSEERHGAIRLAKPEEMRDMARVFGTLGMYPVEYYDLTLDGLPVHSTAFRPVKEEELKENPFRVFTSLLRMDIIKEKYKNEAAIAEAAIAKRQIFSRRLLELVTVSETKGGLSEAEAGEFIVEAMKTFKWQQTAAVKQEEYEKLLQKDALLADITGFHNPHINHLTPRVLDIDLLYEKMKAKGVTMIPAIQGPPAKEADTLLRQTSFQALVEETSFPSDNGPPTKGKHRARFGEVEQRGIALTPKGRELYDAAIDKVRARSQQKDPGYNGVLEEEFRNYPGTFEELRKGEYAYFRYVPVEPLKKVSGEASLDDLIKQGAVTIRPLIYEDFLPVSAAGIFRSNLVDGGTAEVAAGDSDKRTSLEAAIGKKILDPFALYAAIEAKSIAAVYQAVGAKIPSALDAKVKAAINADPSKNVNGRR